MQKNPLDKKTQDEKSGPELEGGSRVARPPSRASSFFPEYESEQE
jgi:hypothetical protein